MKKAFTLIEILVAIGLVMILTGAGIGTLRQSARRKAVENAASDVAAVLQQARTYAASGQKINCANAQLLAGWQVNFTATGYELQELCPQSAGSPFLIKSGVWPDNISPSTLPSANPILFRVLGQGTNIAGQTGVEISGFGITAGVGVTSTGEVSLSYTPGAGPTPPPPPTSCNQVTRCSSTANGYQVNYVPVNPPACNQPPGSVNSVVKSCCTTVLGAAGLDCASQAYVTIWSKNFDGATVELGDARGYKSLRIRFSNPRTGSLGYCLGYYCTAYTTVNFTKQTAVSLPASTNNSIVKINYDDCICTVILEGIVDPSYVAPPPGPIEVLFSDSFGSSSGGDPKLDWKSDKLGTRKMTSTDDETGVAARPSPEFAYVRIEGSGGWMRKKLPDYYKDLTLKYYWRGDNDAGPTDNLRVGYCTGNCSTYQYLVNHALNNTSWSSQQSLSLPVDTVGNMVEIIFACSSNNGSKDCRVDDISVEGRKFSWQ